MRLIYVVLLMLSISAADAKDKQSDSTVRFEFAANTSLVLVPIYVNGHGPYRFLLDTGASHSVLSQDVADRLEIPSGRVEKLITAGGAVPVTIRQLDTLQFGAARIVRHSRWRLLTAFQPSDRLRRKSGPHRESVRVRPAYHLGHARNWQR
jgi:hypothetical protein